MQYAQSAHSVLIHISLLVLPLRVAAMTSPAKTRPGSRSSGLHVTTSPPVSESWSLPEDDIPEDRISPTELAATIRRALRSTEPVARAAAKREWSPQNATPLLGEAMPSVANKVLAKKSSSPRKVTPPTPTPVPLNPTETSAVSGEGAHPTTSRKASGSSSSDLTPPPAVENGSPFHEVHGWTPSGNGPASSPSAETPAPAPVTSASSQAIPGTSDVTPPWYYSFLQLVSRFAGDDIDNSIWVELLKQNAAAKVSRPNPHLCSGLTLIKRIFYPWRCHELCKSTKYIFPDPRVTTTPMGLGCMVRVTPTTYGSTAQVAAGFASLIRVKHPLERDVYVPPPIEQILHFVAYPPHDPAPYPNGKPSLVARPPPEPIPSTRQALIRSVVLKGYHFYVHSSGGEQYVAYLTLRSKVEQEIGAYTGPLASLQGQIVPRLYGAWEGDRGDCYPRDCYCWYLMLEFLHPWHKGMQAAYGPTLRHLPPSAK